MTLSTRLNETFKPRLAKAVSGVGVAPSDLVREGLARVLAEYESTGSVRFGSTATRRTSAATETAGRRATPRKPAPAKRKGAAA